MIDDQIISFARNVNPIIEPKNVQPLEGGFSSQAFKVTITNECFVLLVERPGAISSSNYGHAYVVLNLLKDHNFIHSPLPLWLKDDHHAMAISFFDGVASDKFVFSDYNSKKLAINVIDSLLDVSEITIEEYHKLSKHYNVTNDPIQTVQQGAEKYGSGWFEVIKKSCPDKDIIFWLEPRVEKSVQFAEKFLNHKPTFVHGDPSNPNILIKDSGEFMLIDWGSAKFHTSGPEFLVSYTTHLTDFMGPFRETLIKHVSSRLNIDEEEFSKRVSEFRQYTEVFDVNWAALMMAKVNSGEAEGDINYFRKLANERIMLYEHDFGVTI